MPIHTAHRPASRLLALVPAVALMLAACSTTTTYTPSSVAIEANSDAQTSASGDSPSAVPARSSPAVTTQGTARAPQGQREAVAQRPAGPAQAEGQAMTSGAPDTQSAQMQREQAQSELALREQAQRAQQQQQREQAAAQEREQQRAQQAQEAQQAEQRDRQQQQQIAQLEANRARLSQLEVEIARSRSEAETEARTNAKLIEAIAAAEELLDVLTQEQARYTQLDESGQLREPLQKDFIAELEARKNALLEEVRMLSAQVDR